MAAIIGVHGIMNQQLGRHQLIAAWGPALADGLERAAGHQVPIPDLDIAFYGDVFLSDQAKAGSKGQTGELAEFTEDDADSLGPFVAEVSAAFASGERPAAGPPTKGRTSVPLPVQCLLQALDRRFGSRETSLLFLGELKQVRRYLLDPDLKADVDGRAEQVIGCGGRVVIGHSLGSVVAFEFVRQHQDYPVDLLLTLGSPLGLRTVRALMPDPGYGAGRIPPNVGQWVNVRDPRDAVACAGDLTRFWPGISADHTVDNQSDAHSVTRYLSKREAGSAVLRALPGLAHPAPR
jgi:hypothetical protein